MTLKWRGIIGFILYAGAMFCFSMSAQSFLFSLAVFWVTGMNGTYIYMAHKYMTKYNIKDANKASEKHQYNLNQMFLISLYKWPVLWTKK
jgi:hypothetical protein